MVTLSPALLSFLATSGAHVTPARPAAPTTTGSTPPATSSSGTPLTRSEAEDVPGALEVSGLENQTWRVIEVDEGYALQWKNGRFWPSDIWTSDLDSIEKVLAIYSGPAVRASLGLPPLGYLPDAFVLAPGFSYVPGEFLRDGVLSWNDGSGNSAKFIREMGTDSLVTYRSRYLRHSLSDILDSFTGEGPGIFTDAAPEASRPFRLPEGTHGALLAKWPMHGADCQSVYYDEFSSGGFRISVDNGGFRVHSRGEKQSTYLHFDYWVPTMKELERGLSAMH